ncbi:MAG: M14 family zinc carboxypeptidase [Planctomycetota bacterium]
MPRMFVTVIAGAILALAAAPLAAADSWTEYSEIGPTFAAYEASYPGLCARYDLGLSVEGRHLWALRISDNVLLEEDEPEFKYISTMHGDEIVGAKLCMMLVDYLLTNYGTDAQATAIIDEIELWIVPLMNPDGYDRTPRTRNNAQGVNLNRDFPEYGEPNTPDGRAIETQHIMNWSLGQSFTCSANMHTGALVANYPLDNDDPGSQYTPDEDLFIYISEQYSQYNLPMWNSPSFYHGITNGADWYMIWGGMQDWNYHFMGNMEVTLELSNVDQPPASQIPTYWDDNRESMLAYIETCLIGVRGLVTDATSGQPLAASVTVVGRDHVVYTDPDVGNYSRMLLPGRYSLTFEADGYEPLTLTQIFIDAGPATRVDVVLPDIPAQVVSPNGGEMLPAGVETAITWSGRPDLRFQVQYTADYGRVEPVTVWTNVIAQTEPGATSTSWTPVEPSEDYAVRVRPIYDGGYYGAWDESDGTFTVAGAPACPADVDGDGSVGVTDFLQLLAAWGNTSGPEDINGDGSVDVLDFLALLAAWGPCPQ